jgi:hypothetical protein
MLGSVEVIGASEGIGVTSVIEQADSEISNNPPMSHGRNLFIFHILKRGIDILIIS